MPSSYKNLPDITGILPYSPSFTIIDVGAASLPGEKDPYFALLKYPKTKIIGFEPDKAACKERNAAAARGQEFLPYFMGDGTERQFYSCANPLTSSLYPPNAPLLSMFQKLDLPVVNSFPVKTVRLDDLSIEDVDFLKLDVQGAELDVLNGGEALTKKAIVVHTEVEFIPMYVGQPLFGDIDVKLRSIGFQFFKFIGFFGRQMRPVILDGNPFHSGSQMIYAEAAVYFTDILSLDHLAEDKLLKLGVIMHSIYGAIDVAAALFGKYDKRIGSSLQSAYIELFSSNVPSPESGSNKETIKKTKLSSSEFRPVKEVTSQKFDLIEPFPPKDKEPSSQEKELSKGRYRALQALSLATTEDLSNLKLNFQKTLNMLLAIGQGAIPPTDQELNEFSHLLEHEEASHRVLASMFLLPCFEMNDPPPFNNVPAWLIEDYATYLLKAPSQFSKPGDADKFLEFFQIVVEFFNEATNVPSILGQETVDTLHRLFAKKAFFIQAYFNDAQLTNLYRLRAGILEKHLLWQKMPLAWNLPPGVEDGGNPRVGLLVAHVLPQTESYYMMSYVEGLVREGINLSLYVLNSLPDNFLEKKFREKVSEFIILPANNSLSQVSRIRKDKLDFLLIGTNVTAVTSPITVLAAFRMARVQMITSSSPTTSGFTNSDIYLSGELNDPGEDAWKHYTESLLKLDGCVNYYAYDFDKAPATVKIERTDLNIPDDAIVYFSGANFYKILPEVSDLWMRILAEVPFSHLVLMPFNPNWSRNYDSAAFLKRLHQQAERAGIEAFRVHILRAVPERADVHRIVEQSDVYLDSHPFSGACSLLDPLLKAKSIVTLRKNTFRGSVGSAMMTAVGLGDMVSDSEDSYIHRAVRLGSDKKFRQSEADRISSSMMHKVPFFNRKRFGLSLRKEIDTVWRHIKTKEEKMLSSSPQVLKQRISKLEALLSSTSNPFFASLSDLEIIRLIIKPYAVGAPHIPFYGRLVDVGACLGAISQPFINMGWSVDLIEPDPACHARLQALKNSAPQKVTLTAAAVGKDHGDTVQFHQATTGLSGLGPSPFGDTLNILEVPMVRLDKFLKEKGVTSVDFLKIDTEGWDFEALKTYDFKQNPVQVVMVEFGSNFENQALPDIENGISFMAEQGYEALVFSYDDDNNFSRKIWTIRLIAMRFGEIIPDPRGVFNGNILFFKKDDVYFLASVVSLIETFLPAFQLEGYSRS